MQPEAIHSLPENLEQADRHELIASVAYALWDARQDRNAPDDPEADWLNAEELVEDLESLHGA